MQSEVVFGDGNDERIEIQKQSSLRQWQSHLVPLKEEMITPQSRYTEMVLNAFECLLQSQCSVLIHDQRYNVECHLYDVVGQVWMRFISRIWMKQGFGAKDDPQSTWIWNKGQSKLWQNNNFREKWITPRRSVIDVLMTTEDDDDTASAADTDSDAESESASLSIDELKAVDEPITLSQSQKKSKTVIYTERELKRHRKKQRLRRRRVLPLKCARYTQRQSVRDKFGWKHYRCSDSMAPNQRSRNIGYKAGELDLELSLILLWIGCRICGEALTLRDIVCGAQKGIIPYLRAFESLPPSFGLNAADPMTRRSAFGTDSNYVALKRLLTPNETPLDVDSFYVLSNLLIADLDLMPMIVPLDAKLMTMRYLRECHIPSVMVPITMLILKKYESYSECMRCHDALERDHDSNWKELAESKSESVGCSLCFADSFPMKLIFDEESGSNLEHIDCVDIMALIVISIQTIYRLDRPLSHPLNARNGRFPPLSSWFGTAVDSKWDCLEKQRCADLAAMFGADGLFHDTKSWTLKMTQDFIDRHYRLRPQFAAIHQFIKSQSASILDENRKRNRSNKVVHGPLFKELMELCSSKIGVKVQDLERRVDAVRMRLLVVFECDALRARNNKELIPMMPSLVERARNSKSECNRCWKKYALHLVLRCDERHQICRKCLIEMYGDADTVKLLIMKHQSGILRESGWKCLDCELRTNRGC